MEKMEKQHLLFHMVLPLYPKFVIESRVMYDSGLPWFILNPLISPTAEDAKPQSGDNAKLWIQLQV